MKRKKTLEELATAGLAGGAWFFCWAVLGGAAAFGAEGTRPDPHFGLVVVGFGGASGILFGALVYLGWWEGLPLWLRSTR